MNIDMTSIKITRTFDSFAYWTANGNKKMKLILTTVNEPDDSHNLPNWRNWRRTRAASRNSKTPDKFGLIYISMSTYLNVCNDGKQLKDIISEDIFDRVNIRYTEEYETYVSRVDQLLSPERKYTVGWRWT